MWLQREHFLLSYLKRWSGRGLNLRPPVQQSGARPAELTGHFTGRIVCWLSSIHKRSLSTLAGEAELEKFSVPLLSPLRLNLPFYIGPGHAHTPVMCGCFALKLNGRKINKDICVKGHADLPVWRCFSSFKYKYPLPPFLDWASLQLWGKIFSVLPSPPPASHHPRYKCSLYPSLSSVTLDELVDLNLMKQTAAILDFDFRDYHVSDWQTLKL